MRFKQANKVNKGRGPQPEVERNKNLAKDYIDGKAIGDMCAKYSMSPKRIYEILDKLGVPRNRKPEISKEAEASKPFYEGVETKK